MIVNLILFLVLIFSFVFYLKCRRDNSEKICYSLSNLLLYSVFLNTSMLGTNISFSLGTSIKEGNGGTVGIGVVMGITLLELILSSFFLSLVSLVLLKFIKHDELHPIIETLDFYSSKLWPVIPAFFAVINAQSGGIIDNEFIIIITIVFVLVNASLGILKRYLENKNNKTDDIQN